ncbi:NAD-dependent succinate-semialdehyde dehydrogenase [Microbacterium sp. LWH7-1.2]|uniref:NAD-dependent succinate-semialdehyde dehydrogenase n=1 Tax=Microbacterium sp. LWH7-1.2 TaxID=3135257 RepID=UPI0031387B05
MTIATSLDERSVIADVPDGLFIGGRWVQTEARIAVRDPSSGKTLAAIADAGAREGVAALDAASGAQRGWARSSARDRARVLTRAYELVQQRRDEFALLMTLEMGKPLPQSYAEVDYASEFLRWYAEEAVRIGGWYGSNPENTGRMILSHHPVGPALLITPWNFPLAMATRKVAPAIAAGCTSIIKPAALTPLSTLAFARVLEQAGLPDGVVNVVTTSASGALSGAVLKDARLRKLSFTGSTEVGRTLIAQAAENILRVSMELGGNAPFLVFEDADLDAAVEGALQAKFRNIGQACTAANRLLVHESVAGAFADRFARRVEAMKIGRGTEPDVEIGPLIDDRAVDKAGRLVTDAVSRGARPVLEGGAIEGAGSFYAPTVLSDVPRDARIGSEEIFGPVAAISSFRDEDDAIAAANATEYGLVAYAYTESVSRGQRLMEQLETGMLGWNVGVLSNAAAPFGGVKQSGFGREGGAEGIHDYLSMKYTLTPNPYR